MIQLIEEIPASKHRAKQTRTAGYRELIERDSNTMDNQARKRGMLLRMTFQAELMGLQLINSAYCPA